VQAGLVESLARPGGNLTGNTVLSPDLGPKRLQILREAIGNVKRVVYLANPDNASNVAALAETKIVASAAGTVLIPVEVRVVGDFDPAFATIIRERPDAVLVSNDLFHQLHIGRIIEFLAKNRLPGMFQSKESVAAGGFIAYGPNLPVPARRRLCAQNPARHEPGGLARRAADEVRSRGQSKNRQGAWTRADADVHRARR
jgi:putative ABC transport system substrate-binding protein